MQTPGKKLFNAERYDTGTELNRREQTGVGIFEFTSHSNSSLATLRVKPCRWLCMKMKIPTTPQFSEIIWPAQQAPTTKLKFSLLLYSDDYWILGWIKSISAIGLILSKVIPLRRPDKSIASHWFCVLSLSGCSNPSLSCNFSNAIVPWLWKENGENPKAEMETLPWPSAMRWDSHIFIASNSNHYATCRSGVRKHTVPKQAITPWPTHTNTDKHNMFQMN